MATTLTELQDNPGTSAPRESVARSIVAAGSALGMATVVERGLGFAANVLAARLGGAAVFGGYSLAWTTANNVASYAGGGIGSTATRFSGEYNEKNNGYAPVARALTLVAIVSAIIGAAILLIGAGPLARYLIRNPQLTWLLRWSALSAGAMVLLECCRGFLIGQRQYRNLMLLCSIAGVWMLCGLPFAARYGSVPMVAVQSSAQLAAVSVCGFLIWQRVRQFRRADAERGHRDLVRHIWRFGMVQLASNVGLNAAGWWMASLIARADTTLVQMGVFAVASQLRNIAALGPGLLTQGSYGMIAQRAERGHAPHERVLALCSLASGFAVILSAGGAIALLPWLLPAFFGPSFRSGVLAGSFALATAMVHMGAAPMAARLTVVSLRMTGVVNAIWSIVVAAVAAVFVSGGAAAKAMAIYFGAHLVSAILSIIFVRRAERLPPGLLQLAAWVNGSALALALIAAVCWLCSTPAIWRFGSMSMVVFLSLAEQLRLARRHGWIPERAGLSAIRMLLQKDFARQGL